VIRDRNAARKHLLRHLPVRSMQRVAHKLERILVELSHEKPRAARRAPAASRAFVWALDARVANRAARLQGAMTEAGAVYLPERLHAVRIALKKLRYAMELPSRTRGGSEPPALRTLKRVQRLLGRMHDLQVLIDRVRDVQASLTPPSLAVWRELDELVLALDDMCRRLHARYVREREALEAAMGAVTPPASTAPPERRVG
jgi:CHAD domain-containing protein